MSLVNAVKRTKAPFALQQALFSTNTRVGTKTTSYASRQESLGRPISPHLTIYTMPVTAVSSITNRVSGVGLSAGFAAASAYALLGGDVVSLIHSAQTNIPGFTPVSKFLVTFPMSYHFLAAVRHMVWDVKPELINNQDSPKSSYLLFGSSALVGLGASAYTISRD